MEAQHPMEAKHPMEAQHPLEAQHPINDFDAVKVESLCSDQNLKTSPGSQRSHHTTEHTHSRVSARPRGCARMSAAVLCGPVLNSHTHTQ